MPAVPPILASGPRDLAKPRPVPKHIRALVEYMVRGRPDDPDAAPMSFIEAAKLAGVAADVARRWTDRPEFRSLLRAERRTFRELLCSGNEAALAKVRDRSANGMSVVASVRQLEVMLNGEDVGRSGGMVQVPGLVIVVQGGPSPPRTLEPINRVVEPIEAPALLEPLDRRALAEVPVPVKPPPRR